MQTLICRGQIIGKTILLESEVGLPDGARVEVEIRFHPPVETVAKRQQALQRLFSMNLPVADWEQMEQETIDRHFDLIQGIERIDPRDFAQELSP